MRKFTIEQGSLENLELLAPLFDQYRVYYGQQSDLRAAYDFLGERLRFNESVVYLAVEGEGSDKRAAGFTQLYPSFSSVTIQRLWILNDLFVHEAYRGRGAGAMLLEAARAYALSTGTKGLSLTTMTDNTVAQRLYTASGYVRDEEFYTYNLYFSKE
ncbi:GNAT family N-acetyltransferase [Paenibacillus sp. sgz500958]|uniref:GNAT family N-acetyltransferase n=1 Tax=Paenibacillus sp. sgz500958 TaxID=3242475 RepID=UPI0036D2A7E3